MNLFACKIVYLGTVALVAALVLLSIGNPAGLIAVLLALVLFYIGGRNIIEQPAPRRPKPRVTSGVPPAEHGLRGLRSSERFDAHGASNCDHLIKNVGATILVVFGSLAFFGLQLHLKMLDKPKPMERPRPRFSAAEFPNPDAELFLLAITEPAPEDYQFYDVLRQHVNTRRHNEAIQHVRTSKSKPRFAAWLLYVGYALHETGQHEQAVEMLSAFLELQSKTDLYDIYRGSTLLHRARALMAMERHEEAVDDLAALIDAYPDTRQAYHLRAQAYRRLGMDEASERDERMAAR